VSEIALKALENMDDLDNLDTMMMDQTMSIAMAKKAGDMVAIIEYPHDDHKVDHKGFFQIDLADVARKTVEGMRTFADDTKDMTGCVGYLDCTYYSIAEAIENTEVPDKVFCMEGNPNNLARTDSPCESHPATTNGLRQVIVNLCKLQVEVR
jgi:hypothetical protein